MKTHCERCSYTTEDRSLAVSGCNYCGCHQKEEFSTAGKLSREEIQKKIDEREAKMYAYYKSVFIDGFEGGYSQAYDDELINFILGKV